MLENANCGWKKGKKYCEKNGALTLAKHPYSFCVIAILSNLTCFDLMFLWCARRPAQYGALNDNIPSDCRAFEPFSRKFHRNFARKYVNFFNIQYQDLPGEAPCSPPRMRRARGKYEEKKICTCMMKRTRDHNGALSLSSIIVSIYDFTSARRCLCEFSSIPSLFPLLQSLWSSKKYC